MLNKTVTKDHVKLRERTPIKNCSYNIIGSLMPQREIPFHKSKKELVDIGEKWRENKAKA